MQPIGWTAESLQVRCRSCDAESALEWEVYFAALTDHRKVACPDCGEEQTVLDRRQRDVAVAVDRRRG
jgi:ribosomal protein S27E